MNELEEIRKRKMEQLMSEGGKSVGNGWPSAPVEVTDSSFDGFIKSYGTVVVDCWAPWCGPCRMIAPIIDSLAEELQGKVAFGKLNTDNNQRTAMRHNIQAIPTLLVFKDGKLSDRIVGALPKDQILRRVQRLL